MRTGRNNNIWDVLDGWLGVEDEGVQKYECEVSLRVAGGAICCVTYLVGWMTNHFLCMSAATSREA